MSCASGFKGKQDSTAYQRVVWKPKILRQRLVCPEEVSQ